MRSRGTAALMTLLALASSYSLALRSATEDKFVDFLYDYVKFYRIERVQVLLQEGGPWRGAMGAVVRLLSAAKVTVGIVSDHRLLLSSRPPDVGMLLLPYHASSSDVVYQLLQNQSFVSSRVLVLGKEDAMTVLTKNLSLPLSNLNTLILKDSQRDFVDGYNPLRVPFMRFESFMTDAESVLPGLMVQLGATWDGGVKVWEQYRVAPHLPLTIHLVAIWTSRSTLPRRLKDDILYAEEKVHEMHGKGLFVGVEGEMPTRRRDLLGLRLRCMAENWIPMSIVEEDKNGKVIFTGIFSEVVIALEKILNFTCSWTRPKDRLWGSRGSNGEWTGMIREVMADRADLIGGLIVVPSRAEVIDYTLAIQQTWNVIVVRKPSSKDMTWTSYTKEFTPWAWMGVGVLTFMAPIAFFYIMRNSPTERQYVAFGDSVLLMFGMMTQQGSDMRVSSTSGRIVFAALFFAAQLIVMHYSSFLISMLSVTSINLPFRNLGELHKHGGYTLGIWKGSFTEETFRYSELPLYKAAWRDMVEGRPGSLTYNPDGVDRVLKGKYAYMMTEQEFQYTYSIDHRLMTLPEKTGIFYMALGLGKHSPYKPIIDEQIRRMRSSGVLNIFETRNTKLSLAYRRTEAPSLSLRNVGAPFIILVGGSALALSFLFAEVVLGKRARQSSSGVASKQKQSGKWKYSAQEGWVAKGHLDVSHVSYGSKVNQKNVVHVKAGRSASPPFVS